jgi:hypothetical protein
VASERGRAQTEEVAGDRQFVGVGGLTEEGERSAKPKGLERRIREGENPVGGSALTAR